TTNSSLKPFSYVSAASNNVMPRSNALCMSATASPSVKFPHQPVEIVHNPKPTSLTVRSVFLSVRNFIRQNVTTEAAEVTEEERKSISVCSVFSVVNYTRGKQIRCGTVDCRARLNREPGFECADAGACSGDPTS